jgi:hypothetical protein
MNRFKHTLLAAAGLATLAITLAVIRIDPALAQGSRTPAPVSVTDRTGKNAASVDREGNLGVRPDPRFKFDPSGNLQVSSGDCCPKPSQLVVLTSAESPDGSPSFSYQVPKGRALVVTAWGATEVSGSTALANLGRQSGLVAYLQPRNLETAHAEFPTGIAFRSGDTLHVDAFDAVVFVYGVLAKDE